MSDGRFGEPASDTGNNHLHSVDMNTEYVWWFVVLLLVGGGAVAFLALGRVPEIEDEPDDEPEAVDEAQPEAVDASDPGAGTASDAGTEAASAVAAGPRDGADHGPPVSTTVPGSDEPTSASDTE